MYLDNYIDFGTQRTKEELMCEQAQGSTLTVKELQEVLKIGTNAAYICTSFLRSLDATRLSIAGHMYFVPRGHTWTR